MKQDLLTTIQGLIERDGLNKSNRHREVIYKKCYLMSSLRKQGLTYHYIGQMFNVDHSTVHHSVKTHENLERFYNQVYYVIIDEYKQLIESTKFVPKQRDLFKDIQNCKNLYQLQRLKRWVNENKYKHLETILE